VQPVAAIPHPAHDGAPAIARRCPSAAVENTATAEIKRRVRTLPQSGQSVSASRSDMALRTVKRVLHSWQS